MIKLSDILSKKIAAQNKPVDSNPEVKGIINKLVTSHLVPTIPETKILPNTPDELSIPIGTLGKETHADNEIGNILTLITELATAIHEVHPTLPILTHKIWKQLKDDPNTVTLLKEEDIATVIQALEIQGNLKLVEATAPKTRGKKKVTVDDI